jgi:hypothetical protein
MYIREKNEINPITPYLWFIATHPADGWLQTYTHLHNQVPKLVVLNSIGEVEQSFQQHKENEKKQLKAALALLDTNTIPAND